jgi:DNA-binding NarL/FixJ family response regulator
MRAVRVLLADDHAIVRAALRLLVERIEGVTVVAEASDGLDALAQAQLHRPDVVVMDISMQGMNGIEATRRMKAEIPGSRVLILSSHTTEEFVQSALMAGASGYVVKDCLPLELAAAIEAVLRGDCYLSPGVSRHVVSGFVRGSAAPASGLALLTERQREVLQMIAEGKSTKQAAHALGLGVKTVETHRAALMQRLGIRDVAGLVLFAVRHGLIDVDRSTPK